MIVNTLSDHNWNIVSSRMERRTQRKCEDRWSSYLSPILKKVPVKSQEISNNLT